MYSIQQEGSVPRESRLPNKPEQVANSGGFRVSKANVGCLDWTAYFLQTLTLCWWASQESKALLYPHRPRTLYTVAVPSRPRDHEAVMHLPLVLKCLKRFTDSTSRHPR